jgi:hypothetical protein
VARPEQQQGFLDSQISLISNGISIYFAAKNDRSEGEELEATSSPGIS